MSDPKSPGQLPQRRIETLGGAEMEVWRRGRGRPILLLHGVHDCRPDAPFVDELAAVGEVVAPTHPGFGSTTRPAGFDSLYDLVHHYRAVLEDLGDDVVVIGLSFGGWIAAELAAARAPIRRLVLVDALGVRFGDGTGPEAAHLYNTHPAELERLAWCEPAARPPGHVGIGWPLTIAEHPDEELLRLHASNDALSLYGWKPHMHNPGLKNWLHRIGVPTLVLWGSDDGIVSPDHGRRIAAAIPGSRFEIVERAGHHPELERPALFAASVVSFLSSDRGSIDR